MTFEITKEAEVTRSGDCVVAVKATKSLHDLSTEFKEICKHYATIITVELMAENLNAKIRGRGSPELTLTHASEIVGRKSGYVSDRTLMVHADKAACDLDRELLRALADPRTRLEVRMTAEL
jgi:hypothetical protein